MVWDETEQQWFASGAELAEGSASDVMATQWAALVVEQGAAAQRTTHGRKRVRVIEDSESDNDHIDNEEAAELRRLEAGRPIYHPDSPLSLSPDEEEAGDELMEE